jgi:hypothetical protein
MARDFYYRPTSRVVIHYKAGMTYHRVPEAAWSEIQKAGAGTALHVTPPPVNRLDA